MIEMKDITKTFGSQGFLIGIGVAALGHILAPHLKKTLRPAAVKGTQGVMALGNKTKQVLDDSKEKITTLFSETSEAVKDNLKGFSEEKGVSSKVLNELLEGREESNKVMKELKDSIVSLKDEISHMKREWKPQGVKPQEMKPQKES